MVIEIKYGGSYSFSYTKYANDTESNISTATISVYSASGTELLSSTAMTISGATATYSLDVSTTTTYKIDRNYKAVLTIDGVDYVRIFDIVKYPFQNEVTIENLKDENREALEIAGFRKEGNADSGSTTTLIDSAFIGSESFIGGEIDIFPLSNADKTETFKVTAFDDATGTFTFSPARDTAVTTERFNVRRSFDEDITRAGDLVKTDLWKRNQRAYLILDNTQINNMIVYKFFERLFRKRVTAQVDDDTNFVQYRFYQTLYSSEYDGLPLAYDLNEDRNVDDNEQARKDSVRFIR